MKVIFAGMPKTGTKSMCAALTYLGYNVYDYMENCEFLSKEWTKILEEGGTVEDFRNMYENVDAITDVPGCIFWEEISEAFPEAKIIFSMRSNENEWLEGIYRQNASFDTIYLKIIRRLSPTYWKITNYNNAICMGIFGFTPKQPLFGKTEINPTLMKQTYRRHNTYILEKAPKDRFLHFNPSDGWSPLCKFLGVEIPDIPYPHENKKGSLIEKLLKVNPMLLKVIFETKIAFGVCGVLGLVVGYGGYCIVSKECSVISLFSRFSFLSSK